MPEPLTLHILATRLPDQLLTDVVEDDVPPHAETDVTFERSVDGATVSITAHWQPATPSPNAIERATLAEVIARMDLSAYVPPAQTHEDAGVVPEPEASPAESEPQSDPAPAENA